MNFSEADFEQLEAFRDRVLVHATSRTSKPSELYVLYQEIEILLRTVKERETQPVEETEQ